MHLSGSRHLAFAIVCGAVVSAGAAAYGLGYPAPARLLWGGATAATAIVLAAAIAVDLVRGKAGVDLIALLALGGALALEEYLAGAVIALMYATGTALEEHARRRARRELSALLARAPKNAQRYENGVIRDVDVAQVRKGDRLLVRAGQTVPVDGFVCSDTALLDESALTGESLPVHKRRGDQVASGATNAGDAFDVDATATAADSTYANIVRLVESAHASRAPLVRLADRYASFFVPLTLALAGGAWAVTGDPARALAVVVVATPCPLLLAAPVAVVGGIARAARRGILIKDGAALETLARTRVTLLDKTGTITRGRARVTSVETCADVSANDLLRLAASADQASHHVLAQALVQAARERGLCLVLPTDVHEEPGAGVSAVVEGHAVYVGSYRWVSNAASVTKWAVGVHRRVERVGAAAAFVAVDGIVAGAVLLADRLRPETPRALRRLRRAGVDRIVLLSGDRQATVETIALTLGFDVVLAERTPVEKVEAVAAEHSRGVTMMVGDGVNDAPALAASDVGVAMGARGSAVASQAAAVVLLVDHVDRLADAVAIAARSRTIAVQSIVTGMGLSAIGMLAAAFGWLVPVAGAVVQELIDVAVILNAARASRPMRGHEVAYTVPAEMVAHLQGDHDLLAPVLESIGELADRLDGLSGADARTALERIDDLVEQRLLPHERADEKEVYPYLERMLGGEDPLATMSSTHREIQHLARRLHASVCDLDSGEPLDEEATREIRRTLYGLDAVLRLHFAQEEELYASVASVDAPECRPA